MSQNANRRVAGEDQDHVTASAKVIEFPRQHRPRPDSAAAQPDRGKRTRKAQAPKARKYQLKELVERHPGLNASAKLIGARTCELFDLDEECAFASNDWYFRKFGSSASTVRRAFVALEKADLMHREINAGSFGQNKVRPNWKALDAPSKPVCDDIIDVERAPVTASDDQDRLPKASKDGAPGQSTLTARGEAEPKQEDKPEEEQYQDARPVADAPARESGCSGDVRGTGIGWDHADFDDVFALILQQFNFRTGRGPKEGEGWRGWFCGAMKKGVTEDDFMLAMELDDTLTNCDISPRRFESFLDAWFPKEGTIDEIVARLERMKAERDAKRARPEHQRKPVTVNKPAPKVEPPAPCNYFMTPSMRRMAEDAQRVSGHTAVEIAF